MCYMFVDIHRRYRNLVAYCICMASVIIITNMPGVGTQ